jgi:branched-chain amino acid transport system substrate-binding protein
MGLQDGSPVPILFPNSDPIAKALEDKALADKIPIVTLYYGPTESIDGRVFPYSFPVVLSFYSEASTAINYIAQTSGGKDKLKGLKIATVYHDSSYGKETQAPLELLAKTYGFENIQIPVPHPGNDQSAQWARIRQIKPDWIFLRGWGVMTLVAIKTAAKVGFPASNFRYSLDRAKIRERHQRSLFATFGIRLGDRQRRFMARPFLPCAAFR